MVYAQVPTAPDTPTDEILAVFERQRQHQYEVRRTTAKQRIAKLNRLYDAIIRRKADIEAAIFADFSKNETETAISELGVVLGEIRHTRKHLKSWMRTQAVGTPLSLFGSASEIMYEPKGVCLILSPWNYPFNLSLSPLVSAIAAGNCAILKPSEYTVHSSQLTRELVTECFPPEEVYVAEGGVAVSQYLLELPFNHIFFTGSPSVGKIVMAAAAKHLATVTLELGGKSPVIVDQTANLDNAAAKIIFLKAMNAGQICIAPDHVLVHESVHDELVRKMTEKIKTFFGPDAAARQASPDLCRLVNRKHFDRVRTLLEDALDKGAQLSHGGHHDADTRFMETTLLTQVPQGAAVWEEEIFGPLLPIKPYKDIQEAIAYINAGPQPLAMYVFSSKNSVVDTVLRETRSGGVTVNDCGPHFYNPELPFGGINNSGVGKTHGRFGFLAFTNERSVLRQTRFLPTTDLMLPPFKGQLIRWILKGIVHWF